MSITRAGHGTSSVTANGNNLSYSTDLEAGTTVNISVTPAEGKTPNALLDGYDLTLTENGGIYTGSFQMPDKNANLVINSGWNDGHDAGDMN